MDISPIAASRPALPVELHAATREQHHALNTAILGRLPLCLPPCVNSPLLYTQGMIVFGQIYFAFEGFLEKSLTSALFDVRLRGIYQRMHFRELTRSSRLRDDIELLRSRLDHRVAVDLSRLSEQAQVFASRITSYLSSQPYALLAYTWAMYLALFNGGQWIRRQLVSAGPDFWGTGELPLSFWDFGVDDGGDVQQETLKVRFKTAFADASALLTEVESSEVIDGARDLFVTCLQMVEFLDQAVVERTSSESRSPGFGYPSPTSTFVTAWGYITSSLALLKTTTQVVWSSRVEVND
ncbi:hypothetical protein PV08_01788 [Exophiala spinifera]|uniref:Heme oxygenase-like protein n=1 Tax=Exophiala spinifera TaxID=91928 RepID=A0A0D2BQG1_9EURO|nr:uncharacterized protein PV08_01788 [Exophiala spinifera]KIW21208.1 hypothetical protein PV08_01788 [Exophiala spinifera]